MALEINVSRNGTECILEARGDVDLYSSPDLRKAILKAVREKSSLVIRLGAVGYMDSSGVATLIEGLKSCSTEKLSFVLENPSDAVMKVLQLARLDAVFEIREGPGER